MTSFFPASYASNFRFRASPSIKLRSNFKWSSHEKHRFMTQTATFFYEFSSHENQNLMTRWKWVSSVKSRADKFLHTQVRWQKDDILSVSAAAIKKRAGIQYYQTTTLKLTTRSDITCHDNEWWKWDINSTQLQIVYHHCMRYHIHFELNCLELNELEIEIVHSCWSNWWLQLLYITSIIIVILCNFAVV